MLQAKAASDAASGAEHFARDREHLKSMEQSAAGKVSIAEEAEAEAAYRAELQAAAAR